MAIEEIKEGQANKRQKLASIFVIDYKTGRRKLTENGPTIGHGLQQILAAPALNRVDTTLPFKELGD